MDACKSIYVCMYLLSVCMDLSPSHVSLRVAVDGGWGPWSLWTACGVDCGRQRSRDCAEPEPRHGGRPCDGPGLGADNCTGGLCIQSEWGRTSLRPWGQSAGPLGAVGAKRLQDGDAILPSFMDSVVLQEGAGGASGFVAVDYTWSGLCCAL
jgi:hypothetical protein